MASTYLKRISMLAIIYDVAYKNNDDLMHIAIIDMLPLYNVWKKKLSWNKLKYYITNEKFSYIYRHPCNT